MQKKLRENEIIIFTDGASKGNPGPGGWGAVIVSENHVVELGGHEKETTNNRMELTAIAEALAYIQNHKGFVTLYTDSRYAIQGITSWMKGWKQNDWQTKGKTSVSNKDIWEKIDEAKANLALELKHVNGHVGVPGNERADTIASSFGLKEHPSLFNESLETYPIQNIFSIETVQADAKKKSRSNAKAFSYVSLVDGVLEKHQTWSECEARVKGKSGTRYRKAISQADEVEIIREWGM
jgi:ribonuclease HI